MKRCARTENQPKTEAPVCPLCGEPVPPRETVCPACGAALNETPPEKPAQHPDDGRENPDTVYPYIRIWEKKKKRRP